MIKKILAWGGMTFGLGLMALPAAAQQAPAPAAAKKPAAAGQSLDPAQDPMGRARPARNLAAQ